MYTSKQSQQDFSPAGWLQRFSGRSRSSRVCSTHLLRKGVVVTHQKKNDDAQDRYLGMAWNDGGRCAALKPIMIILGLVAVAGRGEPILSRLS
jgi:hypothetical protein